MCPDCFANHDMLDFNKPATEGAYFLFVLDIYYHIHTFNNSINLINLSVQSLSATLTAVSQFLHWMTENNQETGLVVKM